MLTSSKIIYIHRRRIEVVTNFNRKAEKERGAPYQEVSARKSKRQGQKVETFFEHKETPP